MGYLGSIKGPTHFIGFPTNLHVYATDKNIPSDLLLPSENISYDAPFRFEDNYDVIVLLQGGDTVGAQCVSPHTPPTKGSSSEGCTF